MTLRIYESDFPTPFLPQISLFNYLFPETPAESPLPVFDSSLPAFIDGRDGTTLSRAELRDNACRVAAGLRALGLQKGSTACIWGYNSLEWATAAYGCIAGGVIVTPANYAYAPHELAHQVNDANADLIFVDPALLPAFEEARTHLKRKFSNSHVVLTCRPNDKPAGVLYKTLAEILSNTPLPAERFDGPDCMATAWMSYSSGTTGLPKGVMTSHFNFTSQLQAANIVYEQLKSGKGGDVVLGFLPFSHIYGLTLSLLQPLSFGCPVVVLPRFEEISVLKAIETYRVTHALLVPPLVLLFVHSKNLQNYDLSSLRTIMSGAAPLSPELCEAFIKRLPNTIIIQGYGMTETTPNICTMKREEARPRAGWVGRLLPTYQARLVRPEDGLDADAAAGESGELWVRGPSVMKGYHANPEATVGTMAPGGWLRTGDILIRDNMGWFKVVDRLKELIKYKGYQVAPAELEALLLQHPEIVDTGVVGVWDESQASELPRAYVVMSSTGDEPKRCAAIQAWVAARVAQHKRLRGGIVVLAAIPKSPSGKILRKDLKKLALDDKEVVHGMTRAEARL